MNLLSLANILSFGFLTAGGVNLAYPIENLCPGGYYLPSASAVSGCLPCPAGFYSSSSFHGPNIVPSCQNICPVGHYCPLGSSSPIACPDGTFGGETGLMTEACSGLCKPGFFCLSGSPRMDQYICGSAAFYCPLGSSDRTLVEEGFYSAPIYSHASERYLSMPCEMGFYCSGGERTPCPAGTFGNESQLSSSLCSGTCPAGSYCPEQSVLPVPCPRGSYGSSTGLMDSSCSGLCSPGFWCEQGSSSATQFPCPSGSYGPLPGSQSRHCSQLCEITVNVSDSAMFCISLPCEAGYFCPPASTSEQQQACGNASYYCPASSSLPSPVNDGYYSTGYRSHIGQTQSLEDEMFRTGQSPCEAGYYCLGGVRAPCPAGTFGSSKRLNSSTCSGLCTSGYYCLEGATSSTEFQCGDPSLYCPPGSGSPIPVPTGFYSLNANGVPTTRDSILPCIPGHYCIGGVLRPCPNGFYSVNGSTSEFCDGECGFEYNCPSGTAIPLLST